MAFRGTPRPRRRRLTTKSRAAMVTTDYFLSTPSKDFNAAANGEDGKIALVDNSAQFGNIPVRLVKMKCQMWWDQNVSDERSVLVAIYRHTEDSTALKLDDETEIRNATQSGQFYRRPHVVHTNSSVFGAGGHMDHFFKPLILKNVLLDKDDDIVWGYTLNDSAFGATTQQLLMRVECWWKRV